jgi:sporulation-control protein
MLGKPVTGGALQIDTVPNVSSGVRAGEELTGNVVFRGGGSTSRITSLTLQLVSEFAFKRDKRIVTERGVIYHQSYAADVTIAPGSEHRIPFRFLIPIETPLTMSGSKVWLETAVDVGMEPPKGDKDDLPILPHPIVQTFLDAVKLLGLRLDEVKVMRLPHIRSGFPFVQEFEFKPRLPSPLDELEVYFTARNAEQIDFFIELDRRTKGLGGLFEEAFNLDERQIKLTVGREYIGRPEPLADFMADIFRPHLNL